MIVLIYSVNITLYKIMYLYFSDYFINVFKPSVFYFKEGMG